MKRYTNITGMMAPDVKGEYVTWDYCEKKARRAYGKGLKEGMRQTALFGSWGDDGEVLQEDEKGNDRGGLGGGPQARRQTKADRGR